MRIEAFIFDKDGTLFDFEATWSGAMTALIETVAKPEEHGAAGAALGFDLDTGRFHPDSVAIAGTAVDTGRALSPVVGRPVDEIIATMDRIAAATHPVPVTDLIPCLTGLSRHGPLGVVTNDSEIPARAHLSGAGILELFDFISGFDSGHGIKPEPGPLLACANMFDISPERVAMVGDSLHDLKAGRAAGMVTIGVLTGVAGESDLAPFADVVLPDIGHIASWLAP